jgi:V/A-type H+-transporting ATPase subunit D
MDMSVAKVSPTRINLIRLKKSLELAESGHDILERKRDVLMRELRHSIYDAEKTREEMTLALAKAFETLRQANIMSEPQVVENVALASSSKAIFFLDHRSIMGVTVPITKFQKEKGIKPDYGFADTNASLDMAFKSFYDVLDIIAELAQTEGTVFQIADDIRKTQKRVNALKYVFIPMYRQSVKHIGFVLEEKEREEFVRMKTVKKMILKRKAMKWR